MIKAAALGFAKQVEMVWEQGPGIDSPGAIL